MRFLMSVYRSLANLAWLKEQKLATRAAWKYFFVLMAAVTVLTAFPFVVGFPGAARELRDKVATSLPDFQATLKQGALTVEGLSQPFIYQDKDSNFVFVVDTISTSSVALANYLSRSTSSGVLLGKDGIEMVDGNRGESKSQSWKSVPDFTITKAELASKIASLSGTGSLVLLVFGAVVIFFISSVLGHLWTILLVSLIVGLVSSLMKRGWKFAELFTVGLFATTLPSLIAIVFSFLGTGLGYVHFLALVAFMLAIVITNDVVEVADDKNKESGK